MREDGMAAGESSSEIKSFIKETAKALVDDPAGVSVNELASVTVILYEVSVAPGEMGRIIGRGGRTLAALRTLVSAVGAKLDRRVLLEVVE
jgi:predicted RNA-binding protein YlqC (UPF0109 family)